MQNSPRIVYMGTPDFAVPALAGLVEGGYHVVGVVTMPDKAIGRHHEVLQASPVKKYAIEHHIPVLQPERLKDETFLQQLRDLKPDLQIVVAFRMLPEVVWSLPKLGTFNLHAALLPQYRGAAPINWAIIHGDRETGLTTFFLDHDIDTGRILLQERTPIFETDCLEDVHDRLMKQGVSLVQRTVDVILSGQANAIPQEQFLTDEPLRAAPKIFRETCEIHWSAHTARSAYNFVRGLSPYPAAWTTLCNSHGQELVLKVYQTAYEESVVDEPAGTIDTDGHTYLRVALSDGWLSLLDVQLAGKKRMKIEDFLCGARLEGCTLRT